MAIRELTPQQELFLEALFSEETGGEPRAAMQIAGYAETTKISSVIKSVEDELLKRARSFLASNSSKAVFALLDTMKNPGSVGAANKIKAAESILNRAGVKDSEGPVSKEESGIVILPPKGGRVTISVEQDSESSEEDDNPANTD